MKKVLLVAFVLVLLSTTVIGRFIRPTVGLTNQSNGSYGDGKFALASSKTIWVPDNFTSIQDAVNNASDGDTIFVRAGTYNENLIINKNNLILIGENSETTIVDGNKRTVIHLTASTVTISDLTIQNGGVNGEFGIHVEHSRGNNISRNIIANNECGIGLDYSDGNIISGNNVHSSYSHPAILLRSSSYNIVSRNNASNSGVGLTLSDFSNNNTISDNNFYSNSYCGIYSSDYCSGNVLSGNTIYLNDEGIYFWYCNDNALSGNTFFLNNYHGIYLHYSDDNTFSGNNFSSNKAAGIQLHFSYNNTVSSNTISSNKYGLRLISSRNNVIFHNNLVNNTNQAVVTAGYTNVWGDGYPSGGNYWSDHVCTGNPSDGSQPYIIDENNIDHYPFQDPNGWLLPPPEYTLTIYSVSTGVTFAVDGVSCITPWSGTYSEGASVSLVMPEAHDGYVWSHWLEDGDTNSIKTVTIDTNITLTAVFTPDTTPPTISIFSPENKTYPAEDVPLTFTVSESTSWIGYSLDGQMNVTISGNTTIVGLSDGTHTITVYANDTAGNTGASEMFYFTIDTIPREITTMVYLDPPTINGTEIGVGNTVTVNINISDAVDIYSWQAGLKFNATLLECFDFKEGEFLKAVGPTLWVPATTNNTAGVIDAHGCSLAGDYKTSGSGRLAYLTFKVKAPGVSDLHLRDVMVVDYDINEVPINIIDIYTVLVDTTVHKVVTVSNSTSMGVYYDPEISKWVTIHSGFYGHAFSISDKELSFKVTGPYPSFCNVTIPKTLLSVNVLDEWTVIIDGTLVTRTVTYNGTHYSVYFTCSRGIHTIQITSLYAVPEFPTWTSMLLIFVILTVVIAIYKRRLLKTLIH